MVIKVAVIGAGPSGLACVRHLSDKPDTFDVVCFERSSAIGGIWVYTNKTGLDGEGMHVHSSLYRTLRTNLPKEVMAYTDFPFPSELPSFMKHDQVLRYLQDYTRHFNLNDYIKFETCVERVHPVTSTGRLQWEVTTRGRHDKSDVRVDSFDAVMVCNGHLTVPKMPTVPGIENFRGVVKHSHNFRHPENYKGTRLLALGAAASGRDIAVELAGYCSQIYLCHRLPRGKPVLPENICEKPGIKNILPGGIVVLDNGEKLQDIDVILFCTGYQYQFPFLTPECAVVVEEKRVSPLYKHMIHTKYPTLQFVGLCRLMATFRHLDMQVLFGLAALEGSMVLPSQQEMEADAEEDHRLRLAKGMTHAHNMGPLQEKYHADLERLAKLEHFPNSVHKLFLHAIRQILFSPMTYKDRNYKILDDETFMEVTD